MAREPSTTTYELYFLEKRGWELAARFPENERYLALKQAKQAEEEGQAAKIIRDIYYPGRNESEEITAYLSRNIKEVQAALDKAPARKGSANSFESFVSQLPTLGAGGESGSTSSTKAFAQSDGAVMLRMMVVGVSSLVLAGLATGIASVFLGQLSTVGAGVSSSKYGVTLFTVFVVTFLLAAVPLTLTFVPIADGEKRKPGEPRPEPPRPPTSTKTATASTEPDSPAIVAPDPPPPAPTAPEPLPEPASPTATLKPETEAEKKPTTEQKGTVDAAAAMEKQRVVMMRFLGGAVSVLKGSRPQLDPYNKFGVHLIISGASDLLGEQWGSSAEQRLKLTRESLEVLGTKANLAQTFCDKLEEYIQTPRYMDMVQAGRDAMSRLVADEPNPYADLGQVMKSWNSPAPKTTSQSIITVMFTDMVGSTNLTQDRGDDRAQILVRTHNSIVRGALNDFGGREVKHTGDGIMASFASTSNAVEATIAIQQAVAAQSKDLGLRLRIGLNAGEPIQEENDLFGTTVQLAARICAKADQDQIMVSNVVRELSAGKPFRFVPRGTFELKGVRDPQPLYEVIWNNDPVKASPNAPLSPSPSPGLPPAAIATAAAAAPPPSAPPRPPSRVAASNPFGPK